MNFKVLKNLVLILSISMLTAFTYNYFSHVGIPLFGEWDVKNGVISANSKGGDVDHKREIKDPVVIKKFFDLGYIFIDARSFDNYSKCHIKGAISVPLNEFDNKIEMLWKSIKKDKRIITYCSGINCEDSHTLAKNLEEVGFRFVSVFPGGFPEWEKEGYPVER